MQNQLVFNSLLWCLDNVDPFLTKIVIYMCKRTLFALLLGAISFCTSCVDNNYDLLNKKIATDVKIESNTVAVPVGDLKAVLLDSLIDVNEIELLGKDTDGVYSIAVDSAISVEENFDPITLHIDPVEYSASVKFEEADIDTIHISATDMTVATFSSPKISVEDLNKELPHLESEVRTDLFDKTVLENMLAELGDSPQPYKFTELKVTTGEQIVPCKVDYTMHHDIDAIRSVKLGTAGDTIGTLVNVVVTNPKVLQDCAKEINFRIDFPEIFTLALNEDADQPEKYKIDGHSVCLDGFKSTGESSTLSFYITDIKGIDGYIENGCISIDKSINYTIGYKVDGEIELRKGMKVEDFSFGVDLDVQLAFLEAAGKTKDVKVDFEPVEMLFSADFGNLEHIDTINYVDFDEERSRIKFETRMDTVWLGAFDLMEGYALKIAFPQLEISQDYSNYEGITYNEAEHAFYVKDIKNLSRTWEIAPKRLTLNLPVEDDSCHMDVKAMISCVNLNNPDESGCFYLAGRDMDNMVEALGKLKGDKEARFYLSESDLAIKDAVVHTDEIISSLNASSNFDINEKVPSEVGRVEKIGFKEDVPIRLALNVEGLDMLDNIELDVDVTLPSFLKMKTLKRSDEIVIEDSVLSVSTSYDPSSKEPLVFELLCSGMDFTNGENGSAGLVIKDSVDGNSYLSYNCDVFVDGQASISGAEFHSAALGNDISFDVSLEIGDISVKRFHGIYRAEIESVDENIDLDLGDELEFVREEGNSITLADPQLEFVLKNSVGIPVDITLLLYGNDENGQVIEDSRIELVQRIQPAKYDEMTDELIPVETKLFLTTDTANISKAGYENVEIPNLANLLKKVPHSLSLKIDPEIIEDGVTHHIDICDPIKLDATYSVVIPLKFEDLHLCYNDTITGLDTNLGETMSMFSNVSLCAKMDIVNTIPLGLLLKVVPLDVYGNVIDDIEIDELKIAAGAGDALLDEKGTLCAGGEPQKFVFGIKSKSGDISLLDGLAFSLEAATDHTVGAAAIKGEQGLKISNIVFEVSGDIEVDFDK